MVKTTQSTSFLPSLSSTGSTNEPLWLMLIPFPCFLVAPCEGEGKSTSPHSMVKVTVIRCRMIARRTQCIYSCECL